MDILRLNRANFVPDEIIEGCSSKIWTERYMDPGEFELKTSKVNQTLKLLPEMSLLTHRETQETMFVETRSIGKDSDGHPELTVKGRSLDAFCENRYLEGPYARKKYKMAQPYTAKEAAIVLLWNCLVNHTENDVTRAGPWGRSILDKIPDTVVTDSTTDISGTSRRRWLVGGGMYPQLIDLLRQNKLGIRTMRPNTGPGKVASVSTGDKGIISYVNDPNITSLRWDLYDGVDRRQNQPDRKEVIFHYDSGHIENPSYLYSVADYKTMAFVISSVAINRIYREKPKDVSLAGLDRRVVWVDGGEPELNDTEPTEYIEYNNSGPDQYTTQTEINTENRAIKVKNDAIKAANAAVRAENYAIKQEFKDNLPEKGEVALRQTERVELFDGTISAEIPYEYTKDYFLGDKVTILAEYDFAQTMRVSEYIRTEDAEGDRGYPGLVVIG